MQLAAPAPHPIRVTFSSRQRSPLRRYLTMLATASLLASSAAAAATAPEPVVAARIEVVFVLDTTGSMSGLIAGAKRKIWSIADRIASAQGQPRVRIGLIGYRDRGDEYVTRFHDLDDDVDAVYAELRSFAADGGGDTPESVNQALHEAVARSSWSRDRDVYQAIFLVGDAPPKMTYQDDVKYTRTLELAAQRGIVVNAIQCGDMASTTPIWREIASRGEGEYVAIAQDGAMLALETPVDGALAARQRELAATVVPIGTAEEQSRTVARLRAVGSLEDEAASARLSYIGKTRSGIVSGQRDLVEEVRAGRIDVSNVPAETLPETLRELDREALGAYVADKDARRSALELEIEGLVKERDDWIAKQERASAGDAFDRRVLDAVRKQAAKKGIRYE